MTQRYFAITNPGFEKQLADEIDGIGGRKIEKFEGGVEFDATNRVFYRANYELRTANRIYLRLDEFRARDFPELYRKTRRFNWDRLLGEHNKVYIKGSARKSHLIHTDRIAETVADGLREHFTEDRGKPAPEIVDDKEGAQYVLARISEDRCQLSLDSSGEHLYKRGWRQHAVEAPIRETLAAALLMAADWNPKKPLVDPMCGSGTLLIEGVWMTLRRPPGDMRDFAFQEWGNFRAKLWEDVRAQARRRMRKLTDGQCFGFDTNPEAIDAAQHNAELAGVGECITLHQADIAEFEPPTKRPGMVIANPPYGERLESKEGSRYVHDVLFERFAQHFRRWKLAVVLPSDITPTHPRLKFAEQVRFRNGGIPVRFWTARHK